MPFQNVNINFSQGLNQKLDPWQLPIGTFQELNNSIFQTGGMLRKRDGYGPLGALLTKQNYITTLNGNLTAVGSTVSTYSQSLETWVSKGSQQPCSLSVMPLIRNSVSQTQCDAAIANGLVLVVYTQNDTSASSTSTQTHYYYSIADSITGQSIVVPTAIPTITNGVIQGSSKAVVVGNYFVIVSPVTVSGNTFLQYYSIPILNPTFAGVTPIAPEKVTTEAYVPVNTTVTGASNLSAPSWDVISTATAPGGALVVAYNTTTGGQGVHAAVLTQGQIANGNISSTIVPFTGTAYIGSIISICVDQTASPNIFYINFYNNSTTTTYAAAIYLDLLSGYTFTVTSANATVGATYTNNGTGTAHTFTVLSTISSGTTLLTSGIGTPTSSGTLTKTAGTGDSTITFSAAAVLHTVAVQFAPVQIITGNTILNITGAAQNGKCTAYYEANSPYSYDTSLQNSLVVGYTFSSTGTGIVSSTEIFGIGLASKTFIINGNAYFLAAYTAQTIPGAIGATPPTVNANGTCVSQAGFQPSYFLINGTASTFEQPVVAATLANLNGAGYCTLGLPSISVVNGIASIPYLFKYQVEALNTANNPAQVSSGSPYNAGGIYGQDGVNLVNFNVLTKDIDSAELARNLFLSGGYLGQYDGNQPVENNFFLWPDAINLVYTENSTQTPTATTVSGSNVVTSLSSNTGLYPGMTVTGTGIPSGTSIIYVGTTTLTLSANATASNSGTTLTIQGNIAAVPTGAAGAGSGLYYYSVTYEWTDNQGLTYRSQPSVPVTYTTAGSGTTGMVTINVPCLRLTAKTSNPVNIVIYRYSVNSGAYNQITSITTPLTNTTTLNNRTFVDVFADSEVIGNNILYTTGGVVPDTCAPSTSIMTLFDTRLWLVDAEDPNTLWVSKQVSESTPVEMSNQFTIYVAPNAGIQGSLGPITGLFPMDDKLIIFFENGIYYINGTGPSINGATISGSPLGQYSQPTFITTIVGCNNQQSIVLTEKGLMFQSNKGIYLLDRNLQPSYVGAPVEDFNSYTVNSANVIPNSNYIVFTLDGTNTQLMYDYYYGQWGTFVGPWPVSSCIYQDLHTMVDKYGNILQQTPGQYLDNADPVLMSFTTSWINLASLQGYERFKDFYLLANFLSPHSLMCQVAYDYNPSILNQKLITPRNYSSPIGSPFGVPTPFGSSTQLEQYRIHAKKQLCQSFQLTIQEVFNPAYSTIPGAGFTMSGITAEVMVKKGTRPIRGASSVGVS